jgi:hypothetical protein
MKQTSRLFGIGLSILFVILGVYVATDVSKYNPDGSLSWQNYAGIACAVFFGIVLIAALYNLIKGRPKL